MKNTLLRRQIALLGSTGSIGRQTLDVVRFHGDLFTVSLLTANNNAELLAVQAREFIPDAVVIANTERYQWLKDALADLPIKVWAGEDAIAQAVCSDNVDIVLNALVGCAGLLPTVNAIGAGKAIALANKETLVVAGELVTALAAKHRTPMLPVDSEHSAIFQCLVGENSNAIEKLILTASGGPFRTFTVEQIADATKKEALRHPNWSMGAKITIDSASMMNKGFEMIEAHWEFGVPMDKIQVLVHPQSIVHSMVQFRDSSVKAQLGLPDMRLPIQYALSFPDRIDADFPRLDFLKFSELTFEEPDTKRFPCLTLAVDASKRGGNIPCVLNAANEVVVNAFLNDRIGFTDISDIIATVMDKATFIAKPSLDDYIQTNNETRKITEEQIN
jgi:1-deoxy-D-xylulose-5-phosphate reductoisomerase